MMRQKLSESIIVFFILQSFIYAAPVFNELQQFRQPDGNRVSLRLFGDEFSMRAETEEGYTVVREKESNWICYATLNDSGQLVSTGIKVSDGNGPSLLGKRTAFPPKHLVASSEVMNMQRQTARDKLFNGFTVDYQDYLRQNLTKRQAVQDSLPARKDASYFTGTITGLVVVWDFPDEPITKYAESEQAALENLERKFNSLDPQDNSLRYYFRTYSGGKLDLVHIIKGIYRAPRNYTYYDTELDYGEGHNQLIETALFQLQDEGFDFGQISTNGDGRIRSLCISNTGRAQTWAEGMWMHSGHMRSSFDADGVRAGPLCTCNESGGALHHEMGHLIGEWPDLYSAEGVETGTWDIMGGGHTDLPNPYFLYRNGWLEAVNIANLESGSLVTGSGTDPGTAHVYFKSSRPRNFFFIKPYTRALPLSSRLPDQGLTIWHINLDGNNFRYPDEPLMVELVHANNDIENKRSNVCFKAAGLSAFSDETVPHANWRDGSSSGLTIYEISDPGPEMTFRMGAGLKFVNVTATEGGIVTPSGLCGVKENSRLVINMNAEEGYNLSEVLYDGQVIEVSDSLVLDSVRSDHEINVRFSVTKPFTTAGDFFIRSYDGLYVMPVGGNSSNGTSVAPQATGSPLLSAVWEMAPDIEGVTSLTYKGSSGCADIFGAEVSPGAGLVVWSCHGEENQKFAVYDVGGGWYRIRSRHSGLFLQTPFADGQSVDSEITQQYFSDKAGGQLYRIIDAGLVHGISARIEAEDFTSADRSVTGRDESGTGHISYLENTAWSAYSLDPEGESNLMLVFRYRSNAQGSLLFNSVDGLLESLSTADTEGEWMVDSVTISGFSGSSPFEISRAEGDVLMIDWFEFHSIPTVQTAGAHDNRALGLAVKNNVIRCSGLAGKQRAIVSVHTLDGKIIVKKRVAASDPFIDLRTFPEGMYLIRFEMPGKRITTRYMKQSGSALPYRQTTGVSSR